MKFIKIGDNKHLINISAADSIMLNEARGYIEFLNGRELIRRLDFDDNNAASNAFKKLEALLSELTLEITSKGEVNVTLEKM